MSEVELENIRLKIWCGILIALNIITVGVMIYEYHAWHAIFMEMS